VSSHPGYPYGHDPRPVSTSHSGQWGLASLLTGLGVLLLVPLLLIVFFLLLNTIWDSKKNDDATVKLITTAVYVVVLGLVGLGVLSFLFGIIGMVSALVRGQPGGLSVAGSVVSLVALVLAIILMLGSFRILTDFKKHVETIRQKK
jgi:hypothetical protein